MPGDPQPPSVPTTADLPSYRTPLRQHNFPTPSYKFSVFTICSLRNFPRAPLAPPRDARHWRCNLGVSEKVQGFKIDTVDLTLGDFARAAYWDVRPADPNGVPTPLVGNPRVGGLWLLGRPCFKQLLDPTPRSLWQSTTTCLPAPAQLIPQDLRPTTPCNVVQVQLRSHLSSTRAKRTPTPPHHVTGISPT